MALTVRQNAAYRYYVNVYRKKRDVATGDMTYAAVLTSQRVGLFSTMNFDTPAAGGIGRIKQDNMLTLDYMHTEAGLNVRGEDFVKIVSAVDNTASPMIGEWFKVMGDGKEREIAGRRRGNYQRFMINFSNDPTA